jgi:ectoine hydroxylase-related dioxygenase (phytanoyl-CoA dioxygenase family)
MLDTSLALNTAVEAFPETGYVVLPDLLSSSDVDGLWDAFEALPLIKQESPIIGWRAEAGERALVVDQRFLNVATHPTLVDCMRAVIGNDVQLIDYVAMEIGAQSGKHRAWHVDFPCFTYPTCLTAIAGIYLNDMTDELGPLHVIPGSHAWQRIPGAEKETEVDGEVKVAVRAGSAVVFNTQLWHTGSRNQSDHPRRALFLNYAHYWMKRMDEFHAGCLPGLVAGSADPLIRQLFGIELAAESIWGLGYTRAREKVRI